MIGKRIIFLQAAHTAVDERVRYHQARTLEESGHTVEVYGLDSFSSFAVKQADIYIVDTPKALWKVRRNSAQIVYDITEWYPSKKNLRNIRFGKCIKAFILLLANIWAGCRANAFIFGEVDKARPFRLLFPRKKHIFLPYYPDLQYISARTPRSITKECRLLYAGPLTAEKGWYRVLQTVKEVALLRTDLQITLDVITRDSISSETMPENVHIHSYPYMPFEEFCQQITNYDIFLDLRDNDYENTRCMPIKIFYYAACGRPSIYTRLRAISKGFPEVEQCATLVEDSTAAVHAILEYIDNTEHYAKHCQNAQQLARNTYNWNNIKDSFLQLIDEL